MTDDTKDYSRMTIKQLGNDVASRHYWYGGKYSLDQEMIELRDKHQIPVSKQEIVKEAERQRQMHNVRSAECFDDIKLVLIDMLGGDV